MDATERLDRPAPTNRLLRAACAAALAAAAGCAVASTEMPAADAATRLVVRDGEFKNVEIVAEKSLPPKFTVVLDRDMPTPGWRFEIDGIEVLHEEGRIVARVSEIGPTGITSQVITETKLRLELGVLRSGTYSLEIRLRKGTAGPYRLAGAIVLVASSAPRPAP
jgi:hypothetical protein